MMRTWSRTALVLPLIVLGCTGQGAAIGGNAGSTSSGKHSIPPDYVLTPNGYEHASCLVEIKQGEKLAPSGMIIEPDGKIRHVDMCSYPSLDLDGKEIIVRPNDWNTGVPCGGGTIGGGSDAPIWNAYVQAKVNLDNGPVTWLSSQWTVPDYPEYNGQETTYIWNGLMSSGKDELLQPVLGWNAGYCTHKGGNCNYYSVSAWDYNNNSTGNTYYSEPIRVNPGDTISGWVDGGDGAHWTVTVNVNGNFATALETGTCTAAGENNDYINEWGTNPCIPTTGNTFSYVLPAVIEVHPPSGYYYTICNQLPGSYYDYFYNTIVYQNGYPISPSWTTYGAGLCNFYAYAGNPMILTWRDY